MSQPFDEEPQSFLDLENPGDEITSLDMPSSPPFTQEVPTLHELLSFLDMEILEDEISAIPTASQGQPSRENPNGEAASAQNIHAHVSPLDLANVSGARYHSAIAVDIPWHPQPARVRQARHPIIQVPEPQASASSLNTENLAEKVDTTPITLPLSSQRRPSQVQPCTIVKDLPSSHTHVSSPRDSEKGFGNNDGSRIMGTLAIGGLCLCAFFGVTFIALGIFISRHQGTLGDTVLPPGPWRTSDLPPIYQVYKGVVTILPGLNPYTQQVMSFGLDIIVTLCTESIGYIHSVALRSALAFESQLHYNTNLRLLPPLRVNSWIHPNGTLCNAIMAFFLILSYASSSMVFIQLKSAVYTDGSTTWYSTAVFAEPLIVLGTSLLLPTIISLFSIWKTTVLTWSFSSFDITKALLQAERIARIRGKCMTNVVDTTSTLPRRTLSDRQPSAWESHPNVPVIVSLIWALALAFALAAVANFCVWLWFNDNSTTTVAVTPISWALLPNDNSNQNDYYKGVDPVQGYPYWARNLLIVTITQGFLTLGLHGCEVVINVVRDEAQWRLATSATGLQLLRNPLLSQLSNWPNVALLLAKPFLHWMFSLALDVRGFVTPLNNDMLSLELDIRTAQTLYLSITMFVIAIALTFLARRRPRGYQPAAYGHIQTLANVVDKFTSTLHWGEKPGRGEAGEFYNTGTDDHPLPQPQISDWFSMV